MREEGGGKREKREGGGSYKDNSPGRRLLVESPVLWCTSGDMQVTRTLLTFQSLFIPPDS